MAIKMKVLPFKMNMRNWKICTKRLKLIIKNLTGTGKLAKTQRKVEHKAKNNYQTAAPRLQYVVHQAVQAQPALVLPVATVHLLTQPLMVNWSTCVLQLVSLAKGRRKITYQRPDDYHHQRNDKKQRKALALISEEHATLDLKEDVSKGKKRGLPYINNTKDRSEQQTCQADEVQNLRKVSISDLRYTQPYQSHGRRSWT
jgi:hypothetical protein